MTEEKPAAAPKPAVSPPPVEMLDEQLKAFLEEKLRTGDSVTVETKRPALTGRIFRMMLEEGWIAIEHVDGRRRAFYLIEGGTITSHNGQVFQLPAVPGK